MKRRRRFSRGFTLIELMIIVAIVGILATLALGFSTQFRRRSRFNMVTRQVYSGLNIARARAIKSSRRVNVHVTPNQGVFVFVDRGGDNVYSEGTDELYFEYPKGTGPFSESFIGSGDKGDAWPPGITVTSTLTDGVFIFDSQGFLIDVNDEPTAGRVTLTDSTLGETRTVDVTLAGALRIK